MPEEPKNGQEVVAEQKQPEAVSTSEKTAESPLPEDTSARTKAEFEKLTQHNKELAEENRRLKETRENSVLDSLKPKPQAEAPQNYPFLAPGEKEDIYSKLVDENGYLDAELLRQTLKEANERAKLAEARATRLEQQVSSVEESRQVREAHSKYPMLDPKNPNFDERFYTAVRNELIGQMVQGEKDFVKAADNVAGWYKPVKPEEASEQAAQKEQQVRQIQATTTKGEVKMSSDYADLVRRTQRGDTAALMERLKRAGY